MQRLTLHPTLDLPPTRSPSATSALPSSLRLPSSSTKHYHPTRSAEGSDALSSAEESGSLAFIGTATTILTYAGARLMTDPNFLHAGDHVHLGPGVVGTRLTEPAIASLHHLPRIDLVLLSHYHADHFDQVVEQDLRRDLPIITTPHAHKCLTEDKLQQGDGSEAFTAVHALEVGDSMLVDVEAKQEPRQPAIRIVAMPGKHVPDGLLSSLNDLVGAVPPSNGWIVELGTTTNDHFHCGYRIYISGDTLFVDELKDIAARYPSSPDGSPSIDLMLVHLGGTTIPSPSMPLLMVTMDAKQGIQLIRLVNPDVTIPIHYDDYDVFLSPLEDFQKAVQEAGLSDRVVYLDRGDEYRFKVRTE